MRKGITKSTLTKKSQVTIPKMVREAVGLEPGDQVEFLIDEAVGNKKIYIAAAPSLVDKYFGVLKTKNQKVLSDKELHEEFEKGVAEEVTKEMEQE